MADHGNRRSRAVIASRSCDACRARKVKCDLVMSPTSPTSPSAQRNMSCHRCTRLQMTCTFENPTKSRGPKRKFPREGTSTTEGASSRLDRDAASTDRQAIIGTESPTPFSPPLQVVAVTPSATYPTDGLCSRVLLKKMLQDYLTYLYPLIPVLHRPSFRRDLLQDRDTRDDVFLGFILCLCAAVLGIMPSRFAEYRIVEPALPYRSRVEMINRCYDMTMALRGPTYFDEVNFQKFAIPYLLNITFFQLGEQNRSRMMECEGMQLGRLLNLHKISADDGLNCIEIQLRKKGFWLLFFGYVYEIFPQVHQTTDSSGDRHSTLQNLRKEKLTFLDPVLLETVDLKTLIPEEVDDELIFENMILPSEPGVTSLTAGFNIHSQVFWAALMPFAPVASPSTEHTCQCRRAKDQNANVKYLNERLQELRYMLDAIPSPLRQWTQAPNAVLNSNHGSALTTDMSDSIVHIQFAAMRANLHVTHLWLQSIILDQLDAAEAADDSNGAARKGLWAQREEICRQLLHILHSIPEAALEPNGMHLAFKVRDVAVGMLACPYDEEDLAYKRAAEYIRELTTILSRLDRSERINTVNLQSWVDTDKIKDKDIIDISSYGDW